MNVSTRFTCPERLEARIAPSVVVAVTVGKTGVVLQEEAQYAGASLISITVDTDGTLHVDPTDSVTRIRFDHLLLPIGVGAEIPGFIGNFSARLGLGDDELTITGSLPGATMVDLGQGNDRLTIDSAALGGRLTAKGGTGNDTVSFTGGTASVFGTVNLDLGDGDDAVKNTTTSLLRVVGDLIVAGGRGDDLAYLEGQDILILGSVKMTDASGVDWQGFHSAGSLRIGGSLSLMRSGKPTNAFINYDTDYSRQNVNASDVFIGGNATMDEKQGSSDIDQQIFSSGQLWVGGNIAFRVGKMPADYTGQFQTIHATTLYVGGKILSKGLNYLDVIAKSGFIGAGVITNKADVGIRMDGVVGGPITVNGGSLTLWASELNPGHLLEVGTVTVVGDTFQFRQVRATGPVKITASSGDDDAVFSDTILLAPMTVNLGAGIDRIRFSGTNRLNAPLTILGGAGDDEFYLDDAAMNARIDASSRFTIDGGRGFDSLFLGTGGNFEFTLLQKNFEVTP